jgi:hypothetical protein
MLNPDLPRVMHDNEAADGCLRQLYGEEFYNTYASLALGVMKADMWRYAIIYAFGGLYADIDVAALRPIRDWLPPESDDNVEESDDVDAWPPDGNTLISPSWDNCSFVLGLESYMSFNQFVSEECHMHLLGAHASLVYGLRRRLQAWPGTLC